MTVVEQLAGFVEGASCARISEASRSRLKIHVLDALGCAIGALGGEPIRMLRAHTEDFGGVGHCSLIGGGRTAPDRAALYNGALVRYLDFNDSYLARHETCHPSDNLSSVLAAAEYAGRSGEDLLTALAVTYQVQCRLSDEAPVRQKGFDHTTQGAYAVAAGVAKALGLDRARIAHAVAISGTAFNALRVSRTGRLSHWKGLAYPNTAFCGTHAAFLAMRGITGPREVFEGNKGFMEAVSGPFVIDWSREHLDRIHRCIIKRYNAEIHSQSAIEAVLALRRTRGFEPLDIERVCIDIFDVAYNIIGGGEEGEKTEVRTKEQADHSLPYLIAAAILDGQVMPEQFRPERINRDDIRRLLRKVTVRPREAYSARFPDEMPCRITVSLRDGRELAVTRNDYEGFFTSPVSWDAAVEKFERIAGPFAGPASTKKIEEAVGRLESIPVSELCELLREIDGPRNPRSPCIREKRE